MLKPSTEEIELVKQLYKTEFNQDVDDEKAADFFYRANALAEWYIEVTSQPGFAWPEGEEPQGYTPAETT